MKTSLNRLVSWTSGMALLLMALAMPALAVDQGKPAEAPVGNPTMHTGNEDHEARAAFYEKQDRRDFNAKLDVEKLRFLFVQHRDQVKIMDSWARQTIRGMRNRQNITAKDLGKDPLATQGFDDPVLIALDIAFRQDLWAHKNIIFVQAPPIREMIAQFAGSEEEARRIRDTGLVSAEFLTRSDVGSRLDQASRDSTQIDAVRKVFVGLQTFITLEESLHMAPPPAALRRESWVNPHALLDRLENYFAANVASAPTGQATPPPPADLLKPYSLAQGSALAEAFMGFETAWQANDVLAANNAIAKMAELFPAIDPEGYPSRAKAVTEYWYNRTFSGTLVAIIYFAAFVLFFMLAVGITKKKSRATTIAFSIYSFALAAHIFAMGIRWWLNGRIPIQNQFESVMGSALIGCTLGLGLELWKRNGIFGTAFSFVGFIAATSLLASPYVFGREVGADLGKVAGILNTFWLYIHVNVVIASYALIVASAFIGCVYLGMRLWHWINPIEPGFDDRSSGPGGATLALGGAGGGGSGGGGTGGGGTGGGGTATAMTAPALRIDLARRQSLETLDQANMVVLQLAFWFLGVGIILGAVWADFSWGRPWGWDPKETFALVTWIVYLIIVHVRLVTAKLKGDWTAALAIFGCGVMLFNWIGVNFFLKGLHSYA